MQVTKSSRTQKWIENFILIVCFACVIGAVLFGFAWKYAVARSELETLQAAKSPNGRYVATLYDRDGTTMGYEFVTITPAQENRTFHLSGADPSPKVAEVAVEGLDSLVWRDAKTLIVKYDNLPGSADNADFVQKSKQWRDVQIVYQPIK